MELLRFTGLERHFGAKEVFHNLSGVIRDNEKIGLVGPNGAGKSTLVRLLAGIDKQDDGTMLAHARRASAISRKMRPRADRPRCGRPSRKRSNAAPRTSGRCARRSTALPSPRAISTAR